MACRMVRTASCISAVASASTSALRKVGLPPLLLLASPSDSEPCSGAASEMIRRRQPDARQGRNPR